MKTWIEKLPIFKPSEGVELKESVLAEGIIEIDKRMHEDKDQLFNIYSYVGGFKRETGWTSLSVIDSTLAHLNGCKVRIKIELLEFPQTSEVQA